MRSAQVRLLSLVELCPHSLSCAATELSLTQQKSLHHDDHFPAALAQQDAATVRQAAVKAGLARIRARCQAMQQEVTLKEEQLSAKVSSSFFRAREQQR